LLLFVLRGDDGNEAGEEDGYRQELLHLWKTKSPTQPRAPVITTPTAVSRALRLTASVLSRHARRCLKSACISMTASGSLISTPRARKVSRTAAFATASNSFSLTGLPLYLG